MISQRGNNTIVGDLSISDQESSKPIGAEPGLPGVLRLAAAAAADHGPQLMVHTTSIASWYWDIAADRIQWSNAESILGALCEDRDSLLARIHADDRTAFATTLEQSQRLSGPHRMELRITDTTGHFRWCLWQGDLLATTDSAAQPHLFGTLTDIDHGHAIRSHADEHAWQKRALLENLPDVAWMKDLEGRFIAVNRQFCQRFGLNPEQAEGKTDRDIYPADKAEAIRRDDERVISSAQPVRYESCHVANGREIWVEVLKTPIFDASGKVMGTVGASRDISARKAAERELGGTAAELGRAKERLQLALEGSQLALWDTDLQNGRIYLSEAWARLTGNGTGETESSMPELVELVHPEDRAALLAASLETMKGIREEYLVEHRIKTADGQWKWILSRGKVTQRDADGRALRMSGTNMDITSRKALQQAMESARNAADSANRAKSEFLATISHEIRTPMNGVLGMLELLKMTPLNDEQRETAHMAHDSAWALLRLIDDLLDFSKIEAGQLDIRLEPVAVAEVARQSVALYKDLATRKQLPLECNIDGTLSRLYVSDRLRLSQIINNLLSNAIKFTESGLVSLNVEVAQRHEQAHLLRIRVIDTGIGIPKSRQAQLFHPFVQADSSTARKYGGTGLGLSICERLTKLMGGTIQLDSAPGKGTIMTVLLELPVAPDIKKIASAGQEACDHDGGKRHHGRVLIAEDHPINLDLLLRQLRILGYEADSAGDGEQALTKWRAGDYRIILTDCHMPGMDGYELARAVRREESLHTRTAIPIIACTASALSGESDLCLAAGMNDYLPKPIGMAELRRTLERWMPAEDERKIRDENTADTATGPDGKPPSTTGGTTEPIDRAALEQFTGGDVSIEREIFRQFLNATRSDAEALHRTIDSGDAQASAKAAHRIKGSSRMMGANSVAEVAEQMEKAGKADDAAAILALLPAFKQEHAKLLAWLEQAVSI